MPVNTTYVALRLARRLAPGWLVRLLMEARFLLQPGLETSDPARAARRYLTALDSVNVSLVGQDVLVFGYGGHLGIGVMLLRAGAASVTLCDRMARPRAAASRHWQALAPELFVQEGNRYVPHPGRLRLLHGDIREYAKRHEAVFDLVLSSSVLEHVEDVEGVCGALARLTRAPGTQVHYIDVRDHYFSRPFEMLTFSENVWRRFLNPGSNLNRLRPWHYRSIFEKWFTQVKLDVVEAEEEAFHAVRHRIRPEFLSHDPMLDAAGIVRVMARSRKPEDGQTSS